VSQIIIKCWETEEDRELGISEIYGYNNKKGINDAVVQARELFFSDNAQAVEVILSAKDDEDEGSLVYHISNEESGLYIEDNTSLFSRNDISCA
jgi:hypothetical protein